MRSSIDDDLAAIDASARSGPSRGAPSSSRGDSRPQQMSTKPAPGIPKRGSGVMGAPPAGLTAASLMQHEQSYGSKPTAKKTDWKNFELPEIPPFKPTPLAEIPAFKPAKPQAARMSEAQRMLERQKMMVREASTKSGTEDHRPLVGGFAAAAYEAAREDHFQASKTKNNPDGDKRVLPSI